MVEQEFYKHIMRKLIDDTENQKIRSSKEFMRLLRNELVSTGQMERYRGRI